MKKALVLVLTILAMQFVVFAGDLPEAIMTMTNVDVFIGEIAEIGESIKIDTKYALFECYDVASVTVESFKYFGTDDLPEVGHYVAIAAEYNNGKWVTPFRNGEFSWLAARCDSLDPKTLKLYGAENDGMLQRMNKYINEGEYSYDKRSELPNQTQAPAQSATIEAEESAANDDALEPQTEEIISKTQIVYPAPITESPVKSASTISYWYNKPYIKYPLTTLLAAFVSYFITKRIACKIEGKER